MRKYGESITTRIMMETLRHVTSGSGLQFQGVWFLLDLLDILLFPHLLTLQYKPEGRGFDSR